MAIEKPLSPPHFPKSWSLKSPPQGIASPLLKQVICHVQCASVLNFAAPETIEAFPRLCCKMLKDKPSCVRLKVCLIDITMI